MIRKQQTIFDAMAYMSSNEVALIQSGSHFFDKLLGIINAAKQEIHFQTYIFEEDETGLIVGEALMNAAKRGVNVYLICDGYGSKNLSSIFINRLTASGVFFRFFSPPLWSVNFTIGRRLHHKIVVADEEIAVIGGINIADQYKGGPKILPWLDFALIVKGDACKVPQRICRLIIDKRIIAKTRNLQIQIKNSIQVNSLIRFRQNDFFRRKNQVSISYLQAIREAKHSVNIIASYFLPGLKMRRVLTKAAKRGVEVKIILSGISDVNAVRTATRYLYNFLLRNNIAVYEYTQTVLHAKVAVVDSKWVTIGSFNLNHLSAYASVELNVDVLDIPFAKRFEQKFLDIATNQCQKIEVADFKNTILLKLKRWVMYKLVRTGIKFLALFPNMGKAFTQRFD